ncbi:aminotransferase class I/II-fold pyridoxal phosphate-dependent enzyme [Agrococcus sp. Marseille-Q4369]|uniref:aminotransferase class I/II-fold pyridoxal phosphate-dependent enzyme n=1 Tax=Agrococcus sp. Marseille-Q4369 TaxID=2810513 RepID=UPI001B8D188B|nr:aminotransferase class I/II-fold pyridoxal phosphate-dependent enzyme [Agrococcus sp. Marseille-Q4369]QUW18828.1 aminotransferase class I/II-fold pyridoxal phosphate-dependent enzyme [Agrococcus sp. Marseille-Q4369]
MEVDRPHRAPWQRTAAGAGLLGADGRLAPTIFAEMTALATRTGALNLGQGFPDEDGPRAVLDAAKHAIDHGRNQYGPGRGAPELIDAIIEHQRRFYGIGLGRGDVLITAGATEGLAATMLAYLEPGDEVVVFEPYYDAYAAVAALAGAVLVPVPLTAPDFQPDPDRLLRATSPRTRMILVNSPHNPTGSVFSEETVRHIVRIAERRDALIVTDEVYEHLVYDEEHVPVATFQAARERLISISSAGKTFSITGWKVGWIMSTPERIAQITAVKQYLTFVNGAPFQPAVAVGLRLPDEHFQTIRDSFCRKRDILTRGLRKAGFKVNDAMAGYFVLADAAPLGIDDASVLARQLPELAGVVGVPLSAFARPSRRDLRSTMRFAFCKSDDTLHRAAEQLAALRGVELQPAR